MKMMILFASLIMTNLSFASSCMFYIVGGHKSLMIVLNKNRFDYRVEVKQNQASGKEYAEFRIKFPSERRLRKFNLNKKNIQNVFPEVEFGTQWGDPDCEEFNDAKDHLSF